jgi:hypothetical protein
MGGAYEILIKMRRETEAGNKAVTEALKALNVKELFRTWLKF